MHPRRERWPRKRTAFRHGIDAGGGGSEASPARTAPSRIAFGNFRRIAESASSRRPVSERRSASEAFAAAAYHPAMMPPDAPREPDRTAGTDPRSEPTDASQTPALEAVDNSATPPVRPDVVLLGASNISFSLPTVVRAVQKTFGGCARLWTVHGHGRSYGKRSRAFGRELDGILESRFWSDFAARDRRGPLYALLTDIGNDLVYGVDVPQILDWAGECARRLTAERAELAVTKLPAEALLSLSAPRFYLTQKLFFPAFKSSWPDMRDKIAALDDAVDAFGPTHSAPVIPTERTWYFIDPIHVRERRRREAWTRYLGGWPTAPPPQVPFVGPRDRTRLHRLPQAIKWINGEPVVAENPVYADGDFELHQY